MWCHDCGCLDYNGLIVPEMKIKGQLHVSDLTVASGISGVDVGRPRCTWYRQKATGKALLTGEESTDLMLFVTWGVL